MRSWIVYSLLLFTLTACQPQAAAVPVTIETQSGARVFQTELARTPQQKERGLMFRDTLASDHAMLFIFPQEDTVRFWMKNTRIPLDMLFIRHDGIIVHIHPMAKPYDETLISSFAPVKMVLEISGGEAAKQGITVGDRVLVKE